MSETPMLSRRGFLALTSSAAAMVASGRSHAQDLQHADDPLILRPEIEGVEKRYAEYALTGPLLTPSAHFLLSSGVSNVAVFHPRNVTSARPIVFSHAALAAPLSYRALIWQWVSHGFVVLAPQHDDAVIESGPTLRKNQVGDISQWPVSALLEDPQAWDRRVQSCKACLDIADLVEGSTGIKLQMDRPVIAGHGYGAYIAQLILGATVSGSDGKPMSFKDNRFFSGIMMSPQGPGVMGLTESSWKNVTAPCLYLVAEDEFDFTGQPYDVKAKSYQLSHPGYKHLGVITKGTTNTFTGQLAATSLKERKLFEVLKAISTGFLKSYTQYEEAAFADMKSQYFQRMSLGAIREFIR